MLVQKGIHLPKVEDLENCPLISLDRLRLGPEADNEEEVRRLWLIERSKGIGASDVPIIMGTSKFKSKYTLWMEMKGLVERDAEESLRQMCGNELEDGTARVFARMNKGVGQLVDPHRAGVVHPAMPWLVASIDRYLFLKRLDNDIDDAIGPSVMRNRFWIPLEIKMVDTYAKKDWDKFVIPEMYYDQVQAQLDATERPVAIVMALFGGNTPGVWTVWRDEDRCAEIRAAVEAFKLSLDNNEQPEPDDEESTQETQKRLWPVQSDMTLPMDEQIANECAVYLECVERLKKAAEVKAKLEARQMLAANRVREYLKNARLTESHRFKATWQNQDATIKDTEEMLKDAEYTAAKTALTRIEDRYKRKRQIRVLRITEKKPK